MTVDFRHCTPEQKKICITISEFYDRLQEPYLGAIYALKHIDNPERLVHFAHSLREVIDLLTKKNMTNSGERRKPIDHSERIFLLKQVIDLKGQGSISNDSRYDRLVNEYRYLNGIVHHGTIDDEDDLISKLDDVGKIIAELVQPPTDIFDEIDKIITHSPSIKDAEKLKHLAVPYASVIHMFDKLSEKWLEFLKKVGFFDNPSGSISEDGKLVYYFWAPSAYLIKCVKEYPDLVTQIILDCKFKSKKKRNPRIYEDFLSCAITLPITHALKIAQKSLDENWYDFIQSGYTQDHLFTEKYSQFVKKLFLENESDLATKIFELIFNPISSETSSDLWEQPNSKQAIYPFTEFWYNEYFSDLISDISSKHPKLTIKLISDLLEKALDIDHFGMDAQMSVTYWRSAIEDDEQNRNTDIKSPFVSKLRICLVELGKKDISILKNCMSILNGKKYLIYRRIELHIFSVFPDAFKPQIELSLLLYFKNIDAYHEYYNLIEKMFGNVSNCIREKILEMIIDGYSDEEIPKKIKFAEEEIYLQKSCKLRQLTSIKKYLDKKHKQIFDELEKELGSIDTPESLHPPVRVSVMEPPKPSDDFRHKSVDDVFEIAKTLKLNSGIYARDDIRAVNFGDYVKNNTLECSKRAIELKDIAPYLLYEFFSNIKNALKDKNEINWDGILSLIKYLIKNHDDEKYRSTSYDPILKFSQLLETALKEDYIDFIHKDRLLSILECIVEIGTKNPSSDNYLGENFADDALTVCINGMDGVSFHILANYLLWHRKHSDGKKFIEPRIKQILDNYLDKKFIRQTISRHAVFGLYLPSFYYLDKELFDQILEKIESDKKLKIAFWECYVRYNKLYTDIFKKIPTWYAKMLNSDLLRDNKAHAAYNSTIDHMILAYFYDFDKVDAYFEQFLVENKEITDEENDYEAPIQHCVFQIANVIKGKKNDQKFNKEKLKKLWNHESFSKHAQLYEWFTNSPLDDETTIKLYRDYLERYEGKFNLIYIKFSKLEKYIPKYSILVAECLKLLVEKRNSAYIPKPEIKNLLESLLKDNHDGVRDICKKIIDHLLRSSYDYRDLLR